MRRSPYKRACPHVRRSDSEQVHSKKSRQSISYDCRDRFHKTCGATPLGVLRRPLLHTNICRPLFTESPRSVFHTQKACLPFRSPSEAHSIYTFSSALSPAAVLCKDKRYNLLTLLQRFLMLTMFIKRFPLFVNKIREKRKEIVYRNDV